MVPTLQIHRGGHLLPELSRLLIVLVCIPTQAQQPTKNITHEAEIVRSTYAALSFECSLI